MSAATIGRTGVARPKKITRILTALTVVPLFLTCLGVYYFRPYATTQSHMRMQIRNQLQRTTLSTTHKALPSLEWITPGGVRYFEAPSTDRSGQRPGNTSILYAVTSSPEEKHVRTVIRGTWAINMNNGSRMRFFIGKTPDEDLHQDVVSEIALHGDIILLENVIDTYNNLTLKTLALFEWAELNSQEDYIMKVDTDVYVKPALLERKLATTPRKRSYLGSLVRYGANNKPYRYNGRDKWRIGIEDYSDQLYPPHNLGFAYIVSRDLAKPISQCLPKDFICTAANEQPPNDGLAKPALFSRGGSFTTCKLDPSCPFRPLRFEDVTIGGILFNHLTGKQLRMDCPPALVGTQCLDAVKKAYEPFTHHSGLFVDMPWANKRFCNDNYIAMHRVSAVQAELYYDGGEGKDIQMCSLAPRGSRVRAQSHRPTKDNDTLNRLEMAIEHM